MNDERAKKEKSSISPMKKSFDKYKIIKSHHHIPSHPSKPKKGSAANQYMIQGDRKHVLPPKRPFADNSAHPTSRLSGRRIPDSTYTEREK